MSGWSHRYAERRTRSAQTHLPDPPTPPVLLPIDVTSTGASVCLVILSAVGTTLSTVLSAGRVPLRWTLPVTNYIANGRPRQSISDGRPRYPDTAEDGPSSLDVANHPCLPSSADHEAPVRPEFIFDRYLLGAAASGKQAYVTQHGAAG